MGVTDKVLRGKNNNNNNNNNNNKGELCLWTVLDWGSGMVGNKRGKKKKKKCGYVCGGEKKKKGRRNHVCGEKKKREKKKRNVITINLKVGYY